VNWRCEEREQHRDHRDDERNADGLGDAAPRVRADVPTAQPEHLQVDESEERAQRAARAADRDRRDEDEDADLELLGR